MEWRRPGGSASFALVILGLLCLAVGAASYFFGHQVVSRQLGETAKTGQAVPASRQPHPEPPPAPQSAARISVTSRQPAQQPSQEPAREQQQGEQPKARQGTYAIQIEVFTSEEQAQKVAGLLGKKGYSVQVAKVAAGDRPLYAVWAGVTGDSEAARRLLAKLQKDYPKASLQIITGAKD